ncbi:uncharacterized protein LOC134272418 isoform X2 [Saccostrea cucullata]|uniref:uncharacterized protein LOC134272418 isoform X2 n=1 Tax=Saccostrea cuccullata TaxID=36930 RepID=UPI002ED15F85
MNWMGGARSRIKQQRDKKIQKQFFERRRLMKRNENLNPGFQTPLGRKSAISQDIKAFCLLEQMHSKEMQSPGENSRPIRKIEMDLPKKSRMMHHSSLGTSSPYNTPSKLLLMEPKHQRDMSWKRIPDRRETASKDHMLNKGNIDFGICSKIRTSAAEKSTTEQNNPYIHEDFQPTPVVGYLKDGHDRKHNKSSEVFLPTWTPVSVKHDTFMPKGDDLCSKKDFYHKFCQNPFFETPIECKESKRRKLEVNAQQESKRVLFQDSNILNKCFLEEEKEQIKIDGSTPLLKRSSILDMPGSCSLDLRFHQTVRSNGLQTSTSETVSSVGKRDTLKFKNPLETSLGKETRLYISPTNLQRKLNTPYNTDQMKQHLFTAHTSGHLLTSNERRTGARHSKYTNRHDIVQNSQSLYENFDDNFGVHKSNINCRDELSLLMTSTPVDRTRKPMEIVISPISHTAKKSPSFHEKGFHSNQASSEASVSNNNKHISCHTLVPYHTVDKGSCDKNQSFIEKSTDHLVEEDIAEILAEMDQLEEDQVKEWEMSVYYSQTQSEKDNEIGKMEDLTEKKYDALTVLKAAAAKLEKYVEHYKVTEFGADSHKENDLSVCINQNQTQHAEDQFSLPKLQSNSKVQNSIQQASEDFGSSVQDAAVIKEETGNAYIHCNNEIKRNANLSDSGESDITLGTALQITDNTESCHQMSSSTNDKKCKCSELFVLRSSKECQTEIYVTSTGMETDVINGVSVGIQCELLPDGCDCKLEDPESQDSFHSVASDLHLENADQNDVKQTYHLRSRKKF